MSKPLTCTVEGCERPVFARCMCSAHYQKWRTYGDPLFCKVVARGR